MNDTILEIKDLHVLFPVHKKWLPAVDGVNLKIEKGEITGVVGESGSGKSVMSQTILRLRDHDTNVRYEGEILFEGEDLLKQPLNKIRDIRGDRISVIFQDPLTSLSPVHTVGSQLSEVLTLHKGLNKEQREQRNAGEGTSAFFCVFYKNSAENTKKLLNVYILSIDGKKPHWYNRSYRMTKSQFICVTVMTAERDKIT